MNDYTPIGILFIIGCIIGGAIMTITHLLGPSVKKAVKLDTYECGMPPFKDARRKFSIKYYVLAVLFIVFDIETVFLIPLSTVYRKFIQNGHGLFIFAELVIFLTLLLVGFAYVYKIKALDWNTLEK